MDVMNTLRRYAASLSLACLFFDSRDDHYRLIEENQERADACWNLFGECGEAYAALLHSVR